MTFRAVAWDVDGTLVDSEPLHLKALLSTCALYGVDIDDLPDDEFVGVNLHGVWEALKDRFPRELSRGHWIDILNAQYRRNAACLEPIAGGVETVRALAMRGVPQVAVSNSNRVVVDTNLEALGIVDAMGFSLSLDDVPVGKPDPTPYRMAADRLGLRPFEVLAVEDSPSGIASARAAGLFVVGLAGSRTDVSVADCVIDRLDEVVKLVSAV